MGRKPKKSDERREREERAARLKLARHTAMIPGVRGAVSAAKKFHWNEDAYKAHESGRNGFGIADARKYAEAYSVRLAWLNFAELPMRDESAEGLRRVPLGQEFASDDPDPDAPATIGSVTGRRGIPTDASAQIDVTAALGAAGGLTIISEGVPGERGMTFSAEHVRDYWRLPHEVLASLALRPADVVIIPVQGDSMSPTLIEDDYVFVDTRHRLPSPDGVYALADEFGGIVVKRLEMASKPGDEDPLVRIISDNPRHAPKERSLADTRIIGRVLRRFGVVG